MHHSDRGSPYCSADYRALQANYGMHTSMSRKGNCWQRKTWRGAIPHRWKVHSAH